MPLYNPSPYAPQPKLLYAGVAEYFFGSWFQDASPTRFYVTAVGLTGNVATVYVQVYEGYIPTVGSLISIQATQVNGGAFNVTNATITGVSITGAGVGTITFAQTGANFGVAPDAGRGQVPQPEIPETLVAGASVPVAMSNNSFGGDVDKTVTATCNFPTLPTAATVSLQGANFNQDSQYTTLGTVATVAGGAQTGNGLVVQATYLFYRLLVSGITGTGTILSKVEA